MKLKQIPNNTVVHTPTVEDAKELLAILHENGYKWKSGDDLSVYSYAYNKEAIGFMENKKVVAYIYLRSAINEGKSTFTLASFKDKYCEEEKPQPKFKVGDCVSIRWINKWGRITDVHFSEEAEEWEYNIKVYPKGLAVALESNLAPYAEPDTKDDTKDTMELNSETLTDDCKSSVKVEKELNLCELLKGHEREIFYHLMYGEVRYKGIDEDGFIAFTDSEIPTIYDDGKYDQDANVVLFPSRALYEQYPLDPYTAWMKWKEEQKKYPLRFACQRIGEEAITEFGDVYFRTPADRDKCIEVIDAFINQVQLSKSVASLCEEIKAIIEKYSNR